MATLVWMHKDGQHPELLLYFSLTCLWADLEDVIRIYKVVVEKSVQLVVLVELGIFLA